MEVICIAEKITAVAKYKGCEKLGFFFKLLMIFVFISTSPTWMELFILESEIHSVCFRSYNFNQV